MVSELLPEKARCDYLVALPESKDIGEELDDTMRRIEKEYEVLNGVLPPTYGE